MWACSTAPEHRIVAGTLAQVAHPELLVGHVKGVADAQLQASEKDKGLSNVQSHGQTRCSRQQSADPSGVRPVIHLRTRMVLGF